MLNFSRLALNQVCSFCNSIFVSSTRLSISFPDAKILVSSTNNRGSSSVALGMSFTYIVRSIGPKTDPCGTPVFTTPSSEVCPLTIRYFVLDQQGN